MKQISSNCEYLIYNPDKVQGVWALSEKSKLAFSNPSNCQTGTIYGSNWPQVERNFAQLNGFAKAEMFYIDFIKVKNLVFVSKAQKTGQKNSNYDILNILSWI